MLRLADYAPGILSRLPFLEGSIPPWTLVGMVPAVVERLAASLRASGYEERNGVFIHPEAAVETGAILKGPVVISSGCFVAATACLRSGVFLDEHVTIGPGTEVKSSLIMARSALAHFNFVGDSIIGADVNFEAGAVIANHFNERRADQREISVFVDGTRIETGVIKFGALVGDRCRVGANAVLSPGTLLRPGSVVARLSLVDQAIDRPR